MGRRKKEAVGVEVQTTGGNAPSDEVVTLGGGMGHQGSIPMDSERAEIIAQYEKEHGQTDKPKDNTPIPTPEPPASVSDVKQDEPSATTAADEGGKEEVALTADSADMEKDKAITADYTPPVLSLEKDTTEPKTVRLEALHEEREKRKGLSVEKKKLEERVKELENQIAQATQKPSNDSPTADDEFLTTEEIRIAALERKINTMEAKEAELKSRTEKEIFHKTLSEVDKALFDEGFPGFTFLSGRVSDELTKLVNEDSDNAYLNNPDGWKKIYKERVFPAVKGLFSDMSKKTVMDGKVAAKTGVALAGSHGQAPPAPKKASDEGWTYDQYLEHRMKNSL